MVKVQDPRIIDNILSEKDFESIKNTFSDYKSFHFDEWFSRYTVSDENFPQFKKYIDLLTPIARKTFNSETLLPTYSLFAYYEGPNAKLHKHKDDNACTYTLDMCVSRKTPWDLWVSGKSYDIKPNSALAYYGNDQLHWRGPFPDKDNNGLGMIFFHFAEPDHWWFTKGPSYLLVIRGQMTEDQWKASNQK